MPAHVLIIEDDGDLRDSLVQLLEADGCRVLALADGTELDAALPGFPADVVILDINLPGQDGFKLAEALLARPEMGIIMLTGRTGAEDRLQGLSLGADHYLTKPVDPAELRLMVRNLARRVAAIARPQPDAGADDVWRFVSVQWCLIAPGGTSVSLSAAEHFLLSRLFKTPGQPVPRQQLVANGRSSSAETIGRGLDLVVFRLRRKVLQEAGEALPIASARSIGYVFTGRVRLSTDA
ncbi:response regulator transcription factor [Ancylobacter sp. WKF20]|uniref:response regulator transcription factor n=1 Tax=Ancylobacter sp. WKF20 TaxID=3039801 RepID=UPI002434661A|nr:response regulator transcription factor [Ancylobacter sp. WKF20]WGD30075.1 response regulator transcription factor [Ancylobacter sp. WKF20]